MKPELSTLIECPSSKHTTRGSVTLSHLHSVKNEEQMPRIRENNSGKHDRHPPATGCTSGGPPDQKALLSNSVLSNPGRATFLGGSQGRKSDASNSNTDKATEGPEESPPHRQDREALEAIERVATQARKSGRELGMIQLEERKGVFIHQQPQMQHQLGWCPEPSPPRSFTSEWCR